LEQAGAQYTAVDGIARLAYAAHRRLHKVPCVVVRGVDTPLFASNAIPVDGIRIVSRVVPTDENYCAFHGDYVRDIHGVLNAYGSE
jgi:hypothetical protein